MNILYVGPRSGTALHRVHALGRLGHAVDLVEPRPGVLAGPIGYRWTNRTGGLGTSRLVLAHLRREIGARRYDVALVDGGELLGTAAVRHLRTIAGAVVNYNPDNPYVGRDGLKWRTFLTSLPDYDLAVTPRNSSVAKARAAGARRVLEVTFAADEVVHRPPDPRLPFRHDVVFVGTWMPERGPFLARLVERGVPIRIFGPRWSRAPEYPALKAHVDERWLGDEDYVETIASARISLALLSRGNEDEHTTRSLEIPAIGGLLCGERTRDHLAMYQEGEEAVFWADADECATACLEMLRDTDRIARVAASGRERAARNGHYNEPVLSRMLAVATDAGSPPAPTPPPAS